MTAKEFFRQVRRAERELKIIKAKLEHYEDLGFSLGGAVGVIGNKQRGSSRVEMAAIGKVDVLRDLIDQQKEYVAIIARAEGIIRQIRQEKYRLILTYMYLLGKYPKWISDELAYKDPNSVYRAHGWALAELGKVLREEERNA